MCGSLPCSRGKVLARQKPDFAYTKITLQALPRMGMKQVTLDLRGSKTKQNFFFFFFYQTVPQGGGKTSKKVDAWYIQRGWSFRTGS